MSTSRKLFTEFLECLRHLDRSIDRCVDLFADDGVFEFPYLTSLGMPWRFSGKAEVRQVLELIASHFSAFILSNIEIHEVKEGDGLFVQYHSDTVLRAPTGPTPRTMSANSSLRTARSSCCASI